ncbi:UDP-N-acetylmuramoyl-L-alanine--D-glutamate ligase [bacterium (Candidatus Howlettbacteria) CG_4_10_14_0_8_um_filter_40_9]|nr:MAG: UDP-N-acetylmuramoyl-L-alanine--D-glutamate ligase [bacterium (Candidatus Howlettbacteria) CG_4_10_14_0_8_um_filter_40_9]
MKFEGKKVAIIGFGIEGKATFDFLKNKGASITIFDKLSKKELENRYGYDDLSKTRATFVFGDDYLKKLKGFDIIIRTPFMRPDQKEIKKAVKNGAQLINQIGIFLDLCPCPVIGVTGTKGKGTTSTLIYEILKKSGKDVYLGGNIGLPAISFLKKLKKSSIVILELSSFQLMDITKSPNTAVVLNVTREHLDWHRSVKEYRDAKKPIVSFQKKSDYAIANGEYKISREYVRLSKGKKLFFSKDRSNQDGCFVENEKIVLKLGSNKIKITDVLEVKLRGKHNLENVTAAVLAAYLNGANIDSIRKVIKGFKGLEHRLELVRVVNSVLYYNDSFSTVPETAIAAINSFTEPLILIAGGSYKGSDYRDLGKAIRNNNVKLLILIGDMASEIEIAVRSAKGSEMPKIIKGIKNMKEIMKIARSEAKAGDVVLLSPACASFGMFKNYKERGNQFKEEVGRLGRRD